MTEPLTYEVVPIVFTDDRDRRYWPDTFAVKLSNSFSFFLEAFTDPLLLELLSPCCGKTFSQNFGPYDTYSCDRCNVQLDKLLPDAGQPFTYSPPYVDAIASWLGGDPLHAYLVAVQLADLALAVAGAAIQRRSELGAMGLSDAEALALSRSDLFKGVLQ